MIGYAALPVDGNRAAPLAWRPCTGASLLANRRVFRTLCRVLRGQGRSYAGRVFFGQRAFVSRRSELAREQAHFQNPVRGSSRPRKAAATRGGHFSGSAPSCPGASLLANRCLFKTLCGVLRGQGRSYAGWAFFGQRAFVSRRSELAREHSRPGPLLRIRCVKPLSTGLASCYIAVNRADKNIRES